MSYCRWSSFYYEGDEYRSSDVYVYEDCSGRWTIHVARRRQKHLPPPDCRYEEVAFADGGDGPADKFVEVYARYRAWQDSIDQEYEDLPTAYAGESYDVESPGECADLLEDIRKAGLNVPQYAIDALREEQQQAEAMPPVIEFFDLKGEFWRLTFGACQLDKRDGRWYAIWYTDEDCPEFLRTNGARYEFIPLPVFTEWFYGG